MNKLSFSNGLTIDNEQIVSVESNQQFIRYPEDLGELQHLLDGRPSDLTIRLKDGSTVKISAGQARLQIHSD